MTKPYSRETASYYDKITPEYVQSDAMRVLPERLDPFISLLPGSCVLDVACGPGHDTEYLRQSGVNAVGIDLSRQMITQAQQKSGDIFSIMDALNLAFPSESFDGLWCSSIFVHLKKPDVPTFLTDTNRLLKKAGVLGIITAHTHERNSRPEDTRTYTMYDLSELNQYVSSAGFAIFTSELFPYGGKDRIYMLATKPDF